MKLAHISQVLFAKTLAKLRRQFVGKVLQNLLAICRAIVFPADLVDHLPDTPISLNHRGIDGSINLPLRLDDIDAHRMPGILCGLVGDQ